MRYRLYPLLLLPLACSRAQAVDPHDGGAALQRALHRARAVEIVVAPGPVERACWFEAERIARERGVPCRAVAPAQRGDARAVRIVVGTPAEEHVRDLAERLGLQTAPLGPDDGLVACFEDPARRGLPVTLVCGGSSEGLVHHLAQLAPGWKPSFRLWRAGGLELSGPLLATGSVIGTRLRAHAAERARWTAGMREHAGEDGLRLRCMAGEAQAEAQAHLARGARARAAAFAGAAPPELTLVLHARPEGLAACTGARGLSAWNPLRREVHAFVPPGIGTQAAFGTARATLLATLGAPREAWILDGAAAHFAGSWWGSELAPWIAHLRAGGLALPVETLVSVGEARRRSPHQLVPLRAALFRFVLETRGEETARALWRGEARLAADTEEAFAAYLFGFVIPDRPRGGAERLAQDPWRGVAIEEPDQDPGRGFGSAGFASLLEALGALGANTAVLVSFHAAEEGPRGLPDPFAEERFGPREGDLRVFSGLALARSSGLRAVLEPWLLTSPSGTLAGTGPPGEAGWPGFFDDYGRAMLHAALLAELAGADGLVLGGGMLAATRRESVGRRVVAGDAVVRREGWRKVVGELRGGFTGLLTYSADSILEARELSFWEDLDAVGCDVDLELDDRATSGETDPRLDLASRLRAHLSMLGEVAAPPGKPVLLTRAGFRASPSGLRDARLEHGEALAALQFDVLGRALAGRATDVRGLFLWRSSSDPLDRGRGPRDFVLAPGAAREAAFRVLQGL